MLIDKARLSALSACAALTLAACSGGTPGTPALTAPAGAGSSMARHGWISPLAKKKKLLYVTDYNSSVVLIYQQGNTGAGPIGEIATGIDTPEGDAVDASGTLYVANNGNNTVTEYPAGAMSPSVTLSTDIADPLDVSVDTKGIVYVADGGPAGEVLEFEPGSTSPNATVSMPHPSGETNAKNGNLYVTHNASSVGKVAECKPLATTCKDLGISVEYAQGVAIDLHGNLLVGDVYAQVIDIYKRGATSPFRTIAVPYEQPSKFALDKTDATLYMADPANFAVDLYDYSTGTLESTFTFGSADELEGVALAPGQKPGK
jgi:DNA-binding beta-propeller fold protein YncE